MPHDLVMWETGIGEPIASEVGAARLRNRRGPSGKVIDLPGDGTRVLDVQPLRASLPGEMATESTAAPRSSEADRTAADDNGSRMGQAALELGGG